MDLHAVSMCLHALYVTIELVNLSCCIYYVTMYLREGTTSFIYLHSTE